MYVKAVFKGDKLTLYSELAGKNNEIECTFKLDATVTPKRIDFAPVTGANKGQTYSGLYEFKGGELRICYRGPRSTRPKDFNDEGDGKFATTFLVLKRKPGA